MSDDNSTSNIQLIHKAIKTNDWIKNTLKNDGVSQVLECNLPRAVFITSEG